MCKSKIIASVLLIIVCSSCKKSFFDINQNPNQVTEEKITGELILPSALNSSANTIRMYAFLNRWMGYWSNNATFALVEEEVTYSLTTSFPASGNIGGIYYDALFDFNTVEQKAPAEGEDFYAGIAKVMKARLFQDLVDVYGNTPYTETFKKEIATPKYDKGEDIYRDLQKVLDEAIEIFKNKPVPSKATTVDIMFKGNAQLWVKFANTVKLKLLINQSEIAGFSPTAELAKITANGGVLMSGQSANVNPGYQNAVNQQNPFYTSFGFTVNGTIAAEPIRANNYLINIYKQNSDPRLSRVFRPAEAPANPLDPYVGTDYGAPSNAALRGQLTSYIGPGLSGSSSQSQWITTSVESLFLYAEAVARGWLSGDEKTAYENAVRESFIWLGVPNAITEADDYMAGNSIADWANAGTTVAQKVKFIAYQKYIAMAGLNPLEGWNLYRRLGVPVNTPLSVHPNRLGNGSLPIRLLYPSTEYAVNAANVLAEGTINQFTSKVFWDK
jgi:hypothetical protein